MCSSPWPSRSLIVRSFLILWQSSLLVGKPEDEETTLNPLALLMSSTKDTSFSASINLPKGMTAEPQWMKYFKTKESGPKHKKNKYYNPHAGYEPYWNEGDWVFNNTREQKSNDSMCGVECHPMYKQYGQICASDMSWIIRPNYKTFKNYCEMISEDCSNKNGWSIVYRGECSTDDPRVQRILVTGIDYRWKYMTRVPSFLTYWQEQNLTTISGRKLKALQKWIESLMTTTKSGDSAKQARGPTGPTTFRRKGHSYKYQTIKRFRAATKRGLYHPGHVF